MTRRSLQGAACALALALVSATTAHASSIAVTVAATAGPWNYVNGGLNTGYQYGTGDHTAPAMVDLQNVLGIGGGNAIYILMHSSGGLTSMFGGTPYVNHNGHVGSSFKDDTPGSSGSYFPSVHMPGDWGANSADPGNAANYGIFLGALVGAFLDANGAVLQPFSVGSVIPIDFGSGYQQAFVIGFSTSLPTGARFVSFGLNDDIFSDNTGSLQVCVASNDPDVQACAQGLTPVPEPGTFALLGLGIAGLVVARRRRG